MAHARFPSSAPWVTAIILAILHVWLAGSAMWEKSCTSDEIAHITGGFTFNRLHDYRLQPENGLLPQRWQALPAALQLNIEPDINSPDWAHSEVWMVGYHWFYKSGLDHFPVLMSARWMNTFFGAATVLLVFGWSRSLFGLGGALFSASFCALSPTMLAHSGLATSDMAMTFFMLASVGATSRALRHPSPASWALSIIVFALACVAKYSAVLLLPMLFLIVVIHRFNTASHAAALKSHRVTSYILLGAAHAGAAVLVIWAICGFRYSAFNPALPPGEWNPSLEILFSGLGWKSVILDWLRDHRLLPEAFTYGFSHVLKYSQARGAFLDGDYSIYGWVSFFPKTFLYKTTLSSLVALVLSSGLTLLYWKRRGLTTVRRHLFRLAPLLVLLAIYGGFSLTSHLNIGHRHILPLYPVLFIACGVLGWFACRLFTIRPLTGWAIVSTAALLTAGQAAESFRIRPHYLAYFNPLVGGPTQGYKHLVDSSLDWGQDLPGLQHWLAENRRPGELLYLSYFGTGYTPAYQLDARLMPTINDFNEPRPWHWLEPGLYALSASMLQHVYMDIRGPWTLELEREYQTLRAINPAFHQLAADKDAYERMKTTATRSQWDNAWHRYETLRFARLCHYLRVREPDAMIGYSILIFRLDAAEIHATTEGSLTQWSQAIEAVSLKH